MPLSLPEYEAQEEADRLLARLQQLGPEWPSEPALRSLSPQIVDALIARFAETKKSLIPAMNGVALVLVVVVVADIFILIDALPSLTTFFQLVLLLFCGSPLVGIYVTRRAIHEKPGRNFNYPVYALTQTDDVRILPTLLMALNYKWGRHTEIFSALQRLLNLVRAEQHTGLLNDAAQYELWSLAVAPFEYQRSYEYYDERLAQAALQALAQIGNAATLARMQQFADQTVRREPHGRVIRMAQELAPYLEARLNRQKVPATLLRASDSPASQSDVLLRAAQPATAEPPQQLLRASTSEDTSENQ